VSQDLSVLDRRPGPGSPRAYRFPSFERVSLPNGLGVIRAHVAGRPLLQAQLVVRGDAGGGAVSEDLLHAGATVLMAQAMPEGTERFDAVELVEAAERLGAELGADAGWDNLTAHVEVPRSRLDRALGLLAEMALRPTFPEREVERLREERLNDLRQAMADPRRRVERAFSQTIYSAASPYARPLGGTEETVARIDRGALVQRHRHGEGLGLPRRPEDRPALVARQGGQLRRDAAHGLARLARVRTSRVWSSAPTNLGRERIVPLPPRPPHHGLFQVHLSGCAPRMTTPSGGFAAGPPTQP